MPAPVTVTFISGGAQDGWVLESGENTNAGGSLSATSSNNSALRVGDNNQVHVASLSNAASNGTWSTGSLNAAGLAAINKTGTTQLRVYFNLGDNDDTGNDYLGYYSSENWTAANRPQLVVTYQ